MKKRKKAGWDYFAAIAENTRRAEEERAKTVAAGGLSFDNPYLGDDTPLHVTPQGMEVLATYYTARNN